MSSDHGSPYILVAFASFSLGLSLASIISILILLVSLSRLICVSYGMIDYNQNLTKNRDWRSMLITLAFYPTRLYQVLMLSFFDCNNRGKVGLWIVLGLLSTPCGSPAQPDQQIRQLEAPQADSAWLSNCEGPPEPLGTMGRQESSQWSDSRLGGSGLGVRVHVGHMLWAA